MNKGIKHAKPLLALCLAVAVLFSQGTSYLSLKLMVENNIRGRVQDALSKIIETHKQIRKLLEHPHKLWRILENRQTYRTSLKIFKHIENR